MDELGLPGGRNARSSRGITWMAKRARLVWMVSPI